MSEPTAVEDSSASRPLSREILLLALPVLAEQLLSFCVGFFDVYLSGRLGKDETSAIGLAAYVGWLASMIFSLVGTGTSALVARAWGGGRFDEARRITARSLMLALVLAAVVWTLLQLLAPAFANLLGMSGPARGIAIHYLRLDAFGQVFACGTLIASAALRGTGDMRTPLLVLGVTNVVNVLVATGCVYGWGPFPQLGVVGIVTGTVTAHICGAVLMTTVLLSGGARLQVRLREVRWDRATAARILRIGGPAALDGGITFTGHFLFLMIIARLSAEGFDGAIFAAHVVGVRLESISYLPAVAWGIAAASLTGRQLGAGELALAAQTGHAAVRQFLPYACLTSVVFFAFARGLFLWMHADPAVAAAGEAAFRLMALYQLPNACLIIYVYALRGAGDTRFPLMAAAIGNLCVRVPLAYLCGVVLDGGLLGAWIGMGADNTIRCGLIAWRFCAGRWLRTQV